MEWSDEIKNPRAPFANDCWTYERTPGWFKSSENVNVEFSGIASPGAKLLFVPIAQGVGVKGAVVFPGCVAL